MSSIQSLAVSAPREHHDLRLLDVRQASGNRSTNPGERTAHAMRAAGLRVGLLPELTDVDTAADAAVVARLAPTTRFAAAVAGLPALSPVPSFPVGEARC